MAHKNSVRFCCARFVFEVLTAVLIFPSASLAIDCSKANSDLDRFICSDAGMKKVDEELNTVYARVLSNTKDKEYREALIRSQRRWLNNRTAVNKIWNTGSENEKGSSNGPELKEFIVDISKNRKVFLESGKPIENMQSQRRLHTADGGGRNAGYRSDCWFVEPPWGTKNSYLCVGSIRRQKGTRVCGEDVDWASGRETTHRLVFDVTDQKPRLAATCTSGGDSYSCPGDFESDQGAHWSVKVPGKSKNSPSEEELWIYDPDYTVSLAKGWMDDCLSQKTYPPLDQRGPQSASE